MTQKNNIKSARKQFQVMRLKTTMLQMMKMDQEEADQKFDELSKSLTKTFGEQDAADILCDAAAAADKQFADSMSSLAAARINFDTEK